jgi:hypothetical protein
LSQLTEDAARVTGGENTVGNISCYNASGADDSACADRDAGADDGTAANPHVTTNRDWPSKFLCAPKHVLHWVSRCVDLYRRAEKRVVADVNGADVENDAVEVEEAFAAEINVRAVVAKKRWLHPDIVAASAKQIVQNSAALVTVSLPSGIKILAQIAGAVTRGD